MPIFRIQEYVTNDLSSVLNLSQLSKNSIKVLPQQQVTKDIYNNAFPSAMKKMKSCNTRKETGTILDIKVKDSFLEKAVPEHAPKRWKSLSPSEIWEEIISGKWSCMCKDPEVGVSLAILRSIAKASAPHNMNFAWIGQDYTPIPSLPPKWHDSLICESPLQYIS